MEDNQQLVTEDELLERYYRHGIPREKALEGYWGIVQGVRLQIFELLAQQDRWMYTAEIARALEKKNAQSIVQPLHVLVRAKMVEEKRDERHTYHRLRPGVAILHQQWLASRPPENEKLIHLRIFELLAERGEMYQEQIIQALGASVHFVRLGVATLEEIGVIEQERKHVSFGQLFYKLRPDATERYQQWLASQQPDEPQP